MSGTSLDGVDAVLVEFSGPSPRTLATHYASFDSALRGTLLALQSAGENELERSALAANQLVQAYAVAVHSLLVDAGVGASDVAAIGVHGQTVRHRPDQGFTIQLNNPALLAELTGISVVADFRSRDVAAGGQGAPLVPAFHQAVFGAPDRDRVVVNIGGIANLTHLPANGHVTGFDTGPGNALMDAWIDRHLGVPFDASGKWAAAGQLLPKLLEQLLSEPYFAQRPPKSTGRDLFHPAWFARHLSGGESAVDVQATLCALTARSITSALSTIATRGAKARHPLEAYVCGGGARNEHLMGLLRDCAPEYAWNTTEGLGVPADWVEAVAFAWLGQQLLAGNRASLPQVTGARGPRLLGAIYPA